jgi:hypothetical protein
MDDIKPWRSKRELMASEFFAYGSDVCERNALDELTRCEQSWAGRLALRMLEMCALCMSKV